MAGSWPSFFPTSASPRRVVARGDCADIARRCASRGGKLSCGAVIRWLANDLFRGWARLAADSVVWCARQSAHRVDLFPYGASQPWSFDGCFWSARSASGRRVRATVPTSARAFLVALDSAAGRRSQFARVLGGRGGQSVRGRSCSFVRLFCGSTFGCRSGALANAEAYFGHSAVSVRNTGWRRPDRGVGIGSAAQLLK